jgi:hypothetical protein
MCTVHGERNNKKNKIHKNQVIPGGFFQNIAPELEIF